MKKTKQIIALLSAMTMLGALNVTAVPPVVSAEEISSAASSEILDNFDFVPGSYEEALEFYQTYGQVYKGEGYICTVQQKWDMDNYAYETKYSGTSEFEILFNQEYSLGNGGYTYEVTLYFVKSPGDIKINWSYTNTNNNNVTNVADFSFEMSDGYIFKQTDPYSWLPDSMEEYETFKEKYGIASIHNGYVVYCNDIFGSEGFSLVTDQAGTGKLESVLDYYVNEPVEAVAPGTPNHRVIAYKPVTAGKVTVTWTHGRAWEPDSEYTTKEIHSYIIDKDLSVRENSNIIPEWVPLNYTDTMRFYNQHGKTYIKDGYICTIMRKNNLLSDECEYKSSDEGSTADYTSDIIYSAAFDEPVLPVKPVYSDYESDAEYEKAYAEYEFKLYEMGISQSAMDYLEAFQHGFDVVVYKPSTAGILNSNQSVVNSNTDETEQLYNLSFEIAEDGTITETDMFAWVPDCIVEYDDFINRHGMAAVINNHIVYCDDTLYGYYSGQSGEGAVEKIIDDNANELSIDDAYIIGSATNHVKVYKPTKAGDLTLKTVKYYDYKFAQTYSIDENLNITVKKNYGDCNADGKAAGIADAVSMQKWLTGQTLYSDNFTPLNADMNDDGKINVFDSVILKRLMLDKLTADSDGNVSVEFSQEHNNDTYNTDNTTDFAFAVNSMEELYSKITETEGFTPGENTFSSIDESVFENKTALLIYTRNGSSGFVSVDEIINNSGELTIKVATFPDEYPTPAMPSKRIILLVDKNAVSDVTSITVSNTAMNIA